MEIFQIVRSERDATNSGVNDTGISAAEVKDSLLAAGELSDDLLLAFMFRDPQPTIAHLEAVFTANAPHTNSVVRALNEQYGQTDLWGVIEAYQDSLIAPERIERMMQIYRWEGKKHRRLADYTRWVLSQDTIDLIAWDSLEIVLANETYYTYKEILADIYLADSDLSRAGGLLSNIPEYWEETRQMKEWISTKITLTELWLQEIDTIPFTEQIDSALIDQIESVAASGTSYAKAAQSMLTFIRGDHYPEPFYFPSGQAPRLGQQDDKAVKEIKSHESESVFKVYPNPAGDYVTVDYTLPEESHNAKLYIYNVLGIKMKSVGMTTGKNTLTIQVDQWHNGVYFFIVQGVEDFAPRTKLLIAR